MGREEKIVGKGENAGYQHFLLFTQCFQKDSPTNFGLCGSRVNQKFYWFSERSQVKTWCKDVKMLVTSIFSSSHNFVYPIKEKLLHLRHIEIVGHKCFWTSINFFCVW